MLTVRELSHIIVFFNQLCKFNYLSNICLVIGMTPSISYFSC